MKVALIGASGTIGSALARAIAAAGHEVAAASRRHGVDAATGHGVAGVIVDAQVVIDASNPPGADETAATAYFERATRHLTEAAHAAGIQHYVALSVVGTDALQASGYFRAKLAHERAVRDSSIAYTIARATQVFEFVPRLVEFAGSGDPLTMPAQPMQPLSADDAATAILAIASDPPANGIREVAGPEIAPMADFAQRWLTAAGDPRGVAADATMGYFGAPLTDRTLVARPDARIMPTRFDDWLATQTPR